MKTCKCHGYKFLCFFYTPKTEKINQCLFAQKTEEKYTKEILCVRCNKKPVQIGYLCRSCYLNNE